MSDEGMKMLIDSVISYAKDDSEWCSIFATFMAEFDENQVKDAIAELERMGEWSEPDVKHLLPRYDDGCKCWWVGNDYWTFGALAAMKIYEKLMSLEQNADGTTTCALCGKSGKDMHNVQTEEGIIIHFDDEVCYCQYEHFKKRWANPHDDDKEGTKLAESMKDDKPEDFA